MILIIWKHVRESLTHNKFRCTTTMNHNITYLIAGGGGILLNENQMMFSQLAKRSERAFPADLCTDHAHYVKHRSSMVLRRNKNMVVQDGQFLAFIFWKCANLLIFMSLYRHSVFLSFSVKQEAFSSSCDLFIRIILNFDFEFKVLTDCNKLSEML